MTIQAEETNCLGEDITKLTPEEDPQTQVTLLTDDTKQVGKGWVSTKIEQRPPSDNQHDDLTLSVTSNTEHVLIIAEDDGGHEGVKAQITLVKDLDDADARAGEADMAALPTMT